MHLIITTVVFGAVALSRQSCTTEQENINIKSAFFRADFSSRRQALINNKKLIPSAYKGSPVYSYSKFSRAIKINKNIGITYDLGSNFPYQEGSFEICLSPDKKSLIKVKEKQTLIKLTGESGFEWQFVYDPKEKKWSFNLYSNKGKCQCKLSIPDGNVINRKWNQILMVWNKNENNKGEIYLYLNGKRMSSDIYDFSLEGRIVLEVGNGFNALVRIDEIIIFNRPLTAAQADFFATSYRKYPFYLQDLEQKLKRDDKQLIKKEVSSF